MYSAGSLGGPADPGRTRIGDVERDQTLAALTEHYVAGRLDLPEFEERTAAVLAAKTRNDLDLALLDLPVRVASPSWPPPRRRRVKRRIAAALVAASASLAVGYAMFGGGYSGPPTPAMPVACEIGPGFEECAQEPP